MLYVINMQTEQFNVRLSTELLKDLEIVSKLLKVNRSEWIKTKLAEDLNEEKTRLLMELGNLYTRGMITKKEVEILVGKKIADRIESVSFTAKKSIEAGKKYGKNLKRELHI